MGYYEKLLEIANGFNSEIQEIEAEERMRIIGQNGNEGTHYTQKENEGNPPQNEYFEEVVENTLLKIKELLIVKGREYRRNNNVYHNFDQGAKIKGIISGIRFYHNNKHKPPLTP